MLIIYRKSDGVVATNSGTNSHLPEGPPFETEVQNAIHSHGGVAEDYGAFRLHDVDDAETVQAIMSAGSYELVFDGGEPVDVRVWPRIELTATPNPADPDQDVTVTATVDEAHDTPETSVTFRVLGVNDSDEDVAATSGEASLVYAFTEPGSYIIEAESATRYGRARIGIEVR